MRGNWKRLLALVLCCALLCCLVPCTQVSAVITQDEYGDYTFTTFEDLKELASRTYDERTSIYYRGEEKLVLGESISIPENLILWDCPELQVPAGVTLVIGENCELYVNTLDIQGVVKNHGYIDSYTVTVSGTLVNHNYMRVANGGEGHLTVTGKIENPGLIEVQGSDDDLNVTGLENITSYEGGGVSIMAMVYAYQNCMTYLDAANTYPNVEFTVLCTLSENVTISEDMTVPENMELIFNGGESEEIVLAGGCTLTVRGVMRFLVSFQVAGTLRNEGKICVFFAGAPCLTIASGGSYTGDGLMEIWYAEDPQDALVGLDLDDYLVLRDEWYYDWLVWCVYPKDVKADVTRLAGDNRFDTAIKAADEMLASTYYGYFDTIIVANGYNFADALSGSYLANVKNAPILLCWSGDAKYDYLNDAVLEYIAANLPPYGTVYLLGGTSAVPQSLEDALNALNREGVTIKRLAGKDRFETNLMILEEAGVQEGEEILVCTATNFADSLSASATGKPILLAFNEYGDLYGGQAAYLSTLESCTFTVIGGESAVSTKLADAFKSYGSVERLAGGNRFETSVLVAEKYFEDPHTAVLAYAWNFPDGLCGGPLAYSMDAPLILTMTGYESQAVKYFSDKAIIEATVLGGAGLISDDAVRSIFRLTADAEILIK